MSERATLLSGTRRPGAETLGAASSLRGGLFIRLVAGLLGIALPAIAVISVVLTQQSDAALTSSATLASANIARAATSKVETWADERTADVDTYAMFLQDDLGRTDVAATLATLRGQQKDTYDLLEVTDPSGRVLGASATDQQYDVGGQDWFRSVSAGHVLATPQLSGGRVLWAIAAPIRDDSGKMIGAVVGNLELSAVAGLLDSLELDVRVPTTVELVGGQRQLIYSSAMGQVSTSADMVAKGALQTQVQTDPVQRALTGQTGSVRYTDGSGRDQLAGYDTVQPAGWAMVVEQPADQALRAVAQQGQVAIAVAVAIGVLALVASMGSARFLVGPLAGLAAAAERIERGNLDTRVQPRGSIETRRLGDALNAMAAQIESNAARMRSVSRDIGASAADLTAVSDQLVATTTDQSAAATETAASMEELARSAAAIAETMERVATQAEQTCEYLREMQTDVDESSRRTGALVGRVNEINGLLELINEIADQTNMLSLNAAIEAARAGEAGRGFTVVAEEVRRLAERSKSSAGDIAHIISSTQTEAEATVMAMEKSAKQMHRSLELMERVTEASHQVRTITQEQRSATDQAVEAIAQVSSGSQQVSERARRLASSAAAQVEMSRELQRAAEMRPEA